MLLAVALAANAFLSAFAGSWTCGLHSPGSHVPPTHWRIAAVPGSSWTSVRWSANGHPGGIAYVGYLAPDKSWIYEDFHDDGSYGTAGSPGPLNGTWTWSGAFTSSQRTLHGAAVWRRTNPVTIRMGFGRLVGTSFRETSYNECRRTT